MVQTLCALSTIWLAVVPFADVPAPVALALPEPDALAALPVLVAALLPASLEPPQPARATLSVINARPWPSHPRFLWFLSFFALFMLLAPLFR